MFVFTDLWNTGLFYAVSASTPDSNVMAEPHAFRLEAMLEVYGQE
jgi:hypothetical protein